MINTDLDFFSLTSYDYYTIFENMQEGVTVYRIVYNMAGEVVDLLIKYANPASSTSRVFLNKKFIGKSVTVLYGPDTVVPLIKEVNEIVSTGKIKKYESYSPILDSYFSTSAFSPAKNLYVTLTTDITEQKKAEKYLQNARHDLEIKVKERTKELLSALKEKELLLNEVQHRVKNNLQMISSLLNLQIPYIKDEDSVQIFQESQNRVRSIAMVYDKLYQSKSLAKINAGIYVRNIMNNIFQTYNVDENKIKYDVNIDNIRLNIETSIPCGLIITELVTNSIKHGFQATKNHELIEKGIEGIIALELSKDNNEYVLKLSDNGIGFPENLDFENTESFGLQLVNLLVNQLSGTIKLNKENGTEFWIKFRELKYRRRF